MTLIGPDSLTPDRSSSFCGLVYLTRPTLLDQWSTRHGTGDSSPTGPGSCHRRPWSTWQRGRLRGPQRIVPVFVKLFTSVLKTSSSVLKMGLLSWIVTVPIHVRSSSVCVPFFFPFLSTISRQTRDLRNTTLIRPLYFTNIFKLFLFLTTTDQRPVWVQKFSGWETEEGDPVPKVD